MGNRHAGLGEQNMLDMVNTALPSIFLCFFFVVFSLSLGFKECSRA
jgi:hypothetical protein